MRALSREAHDNPLEVADAPLPPPLSIPSLRDAVLSTLSSVAPVRRGGSNLRYARIPGALAHITLHDLFGVQLRKLIVTSTHADKLVKLVTSDFYSF